MAQPSSRLNREPAAKQMCRDDAAVPATKAMLPYHGRSQMFSCGDVRSGSVTVLFPAVEARCPTGAREKCAGSVHTGGWGPGIDHL